MIVWGLIHFTLISRDQDSWKPVAINVKMIMILNALNPRTNHHPIVSIFTCIYSYIIIYYIAITFILLHIDQQTLLSVHNNDNGDNQATDNLMHFENNSKCAHTLNTKFISPTNQLTHFPLCW